MAHTFTGKWITDGEFANVLPRNVFHRALEAPREKQRDMPKARHILFRRRFFLTHARNVKIYISADDYYKLYVNGTPVCQGPAPAYFNRYYYNEVDLTPYVRAGENVLAVHTYYQGLINRVWVSGDLRHGLIFDVEENGAPVACSDEETLTKRHTGYQINGVIGYDTQFTEIYDAGASEVGFERESFSEEGWLPSSLRRHADYTLLPQPTPCLQLSLMQPARRTATAQGTLFDFGQEVVAYPVVQARGKRGATLLVRCGEELNADGTVRYEMRCNCVYEDKLILSGGEDVSNFFDYKAFRYVEIICPENAELISVQANVRHYPYVAAHGCKYQRKPLQDIFRLCENTIRYGVQEGYLDCPTREKGQYFGDACYTALAQYFLTDDAAMCKKLIAEAFSSQIIDGGLTAGGPSSFMQEIAEYPLMVICLLLVLYRLTGDKEFAKEHLPAAERVLNTYEARYGFPLKNVDKWCVVDWPDAARDGYDFALPQNEVVTNTHNVICAYFLLAAKALSALKKQLGGQGGENKIQEWEGAYRKLFYDDKRHLFCDTPTSRHSALASNVLGALALGADEEFENNLLNIIRQKRLSCSNLFITPLMFYWLKRRGEEELLLSLIQDENGWRNMLKEGATTTFEAFSKEKKWNTSLFHTMFAFPVLFLTDNARAEKILFA